MLIYGNNTGITTLLVTINPGDLGQKPATDEPTRYSGELKDGSKTICMCAIYMYTRLPTVLLTTHLDLLCMLTPLLHLGVHAVKKELSMESSLGSCSSSHKLVKMAGMKHTTKE